jgi:hypothetical protein
MKRYRVGFRWVDGREEYIEFESSLSSTELAEELKRSDHTGQLETVYVKSLS